MSDLLSISTMFVQSHPLLNLQKRVHLQAKSMPFVRQKLSSFGMSISSRSRLFSPLSLKVGE